MSPLGRYVLRARERRGWTRAELARAADVPYTTLRNIEKAKKNVQPSDAILKSLADALGEDSEECADYFEQMRVLAGYLLVASKDTTERDQRFIANANAFPTLRTSLEKLFERGDTEEIDRAMTALEVARHLEPRRPKEPR